MIYFFSFLNYLHCIEQLVGVRQRSIVLAGERSNSRNNKRKGHFSVHKKGNSLTFQHTIFFARRNEILFRSAAAPEPGDYDMVENREFINRNPKSAKSSLLKNWQKLGENNEETPPQKPNVVTVPVPEAVPPPPLTAECKRPGKFSHPTIRWPVCFVLWILLVCLFIIWINYKKITLKYGVSCHQTNFQF